MSKPLILIFEGARGTGKTTIIESLAYLLRVNLVKYKVWKSARGEDPTNDMLKSLEEFVEADTEVILVDRFHISEYVLRTADGTINANTLLLNTGLVMAATYSAGAHVFLLRCDEGDRRMRVAERGDSAKPDITALEAGLWNTKLPVQYPNLLHVDTTGLQVLDVRDIIVEHIRFGERLEAMRND